MTPPETIAHYRITSKLGEGGMGEVYRALDTKLNREVAIKVIPDSFAQDVDRMMRFAREAQVLASLNHPHIAAIYGVEERALVMELVEGPTLAERVKQGAIPLAEALPIARQIAEALEYAHEKGIIHRDLKPANVKLTAEGNAKVLDFGLAKALASDGAAGDPATSPTLTMRATMAGVIMGTASYMSPEQARGAAVDRRADVWAFGVLLYEMLTGSQMFGGETVSDMLAAVLKTDPDWSLLPADTPPAIRRLLRRCLERNRKQRLPDIGAARLEIEEALSGAAPEAPATAAAPPAVRGREIFRWWSIGATAVAVAALGVAILHFGEKPVQPVAVRFQIPPPEKSSFSSYGMALSPDGRKLALLAAAVDGQSALWVRPLDSVEAHRLAGTEGAQFLPFWSPDNRYIGFFVQGKVKKVEASGGPPQTLCDVGSTLIGGSWNRDGVIIFSSSVGGLYRVSQAGGAPSRITELDASKGELAHMRPWFLPDGRHFLYVTRNPHVEEAAIYLGSLDSKERKRLAASPQAGVYVPPPAGSENGHLLFLRDTTLMAQPLDPKRFDLAGEAFPVVEQVGSARAMGFFTASANGVLAYRNGGAGGASDLVWFTRDGKSPGAFASRGTVGGLALSPDGTRVAIQMDTSANWDIWLMDIAREVATRFTFDSSVEIAPLWSPDGSRVLFASDRSGKMDIYEKDSGGSASEHLLVKNGIPEDISPDGKYLLFSAYEKTRSSLWLLSLSGVPAGAKPTPYLQTSFDERFGQFSPDGHWVAYASNESGQYQIFVQSFPAGAGKFQVSTGAGGIQPRWRRDGKEIFYVATDGKLMAVEVSTAPRFSAGNPKPLFDTLIYRTTVGYPVFRFAVTPDGKRFLIDTVPTAAQNSTAPITVVLNWQAALKP